MAEQGAIANRGSTAEKPAAKKPAAKRPAAKKPQAKKPQAKKSQAKKPQAKKVATNTTASRPSPTRQHDADFEPFAVTANDIEALNDRQFRRLMRELLRNEVVACNGSAAARFIDNPGDGADQGQDAETVRPVSGPVSDGFIPPGTTVWQYKAERRSPTEAEFTKEIIKERPRSALGSGDNYRFVAQQPRGNESVKHVLLQKVATKKGYRAEQVAFHAQATLAERARRYPSLAMLPFFRRPVDPVIDFGRWEQKYASTKFDERSRAAPLAQLTSYLRTAARPGHVRVVGPAGVGKTRLVLHALAQLDLGSCTVYAASPRAPAFPAFVRWCGDHNARMVLVVDECDEAAAMALRQELLERQQPTLLVTINKIEDREIRSDGSDLRIHLDPMREDDIVRILDDGILDKSRIFAIAHITGGFVKLARVVAEAAARDLASVFDPSTLITVDTIQVAVRSLLRFPDAAMRWLGAVALFSEVRIDSSEPGSELEYITTFSGVEIPDVRDWIQSALTAQVLSDRGQRIFVTPSLLAVLLARDLARARRHDLPSWLRGLPPRLQESFAQQMGQLRYSIEGRELVSELVSADGPLGDLLAERQPWARNAFLALGSIARAEALLRLEEWVKDSSTAAAELSGDRALQQLLFRLVWRPEHFARTFRLILRGLQASSNPESSGLHRVLTGALRIVLASSQAPFPDRFTVAGRAVRDSAIALQVRKLILRALARGTGAGGGDGYSQDDIDVDGRRYWSPTYGEWQECTRSVVKLFVELLYDQDPGLRAEAAANLIDRAAEFIRGGAHEPLLGAVSKLVEIDPRIGTLREELERTIAYTKQPDEIDHAIRETIASLPQDLPTRIRILVEGWPLVRDREARRLPERPEPVSVADEIMVSQHRELAIALLFEPWAKNSGDILTVLARRQDASTAWHAVLPAARRSGETWGASLFLSAAHYAADANLRHVPTLLLNSENEYDRSLGAEAITRMEASDDEVRALAGAIRDGRVSPASLRYAVMGRWTERRGRAAVAELIRASAEHKAGGVAALTIAHAAENNLGLNDDELVGLLASTMSAVQGHDAWTWEQVGMLAAKRSPAELGRALITQISEHASDRSTHLWADDEIASVLNYCVDVAPSLALTLLGLWEAAPDFVEAFAGKSLLAHVGAPALIEWATDTQRQRALAQIVVAAPDPTTEALLEHFGSQSAFATKLRHQLRPSSWSGPLAEILRSRANDVRGWAADPENGMELREWARDSAAWLERTAELAKPYDD